MRSARLSRRILVGLMVFSPQRMAVRGANLLLTRAVAGKDQA
jgi:hypothetical protein